MQVFLNGNDITNREQLHDALSEALELPEWYGRSRVYHREPKSSTRFSASMAQNTGDLKSRLLPRMHRHTIPGAIDSHEADR